MRISDWSSDVCSSDLMKRTGLKDAIRSAHGQVNGSDLVIAAMDFSFIGGSMGSVVGEKIARSIDYFIEHRIPFMIISKSGGARMMEAAFSLMQMAKTSAKLALLGERSEEQTSELQSLMRISYAVFCLKKKKKNIKNKVKQ